jgi:hypothetical protein
VTLDLVNDRVRTLARGVVSPCSSREKFGEATSATSIATSPKSFRSRGTRAVGAISLNVLENQRYVGLVGGAN